VFGKGKIIQPLLCAVAGHSDGHETSFLTGTTSGHIYEWRQGHVVASVTAHDAPVSALTNLGKLGYCSIAAEGVLKFWSIDLKLLYTLNALALAPLPSEMSCYMLVPNLSYSKLSVCMKSGEVYEVTLQTRTSRVLFQNHFAFQLHGLACHPTDSDMYATAGDDGFVIVWSISEKTCLRKLEVDAASRALAWSNDGSKLVVGIGGNPSSTVKDGAYMIIDSSSLHILFEDRKSKKTITDIVWTADVIVMGSGDGKVYVHDGASYDLIRTISLPGASATLPIARVELSSTGEYIRIANSSDEVFDAAAKDGVVASNPLTTKDVEWTEYTCPYNWLTQGIATCVE
jgi:WD40 repeat protein